MGEILARCGQQDVEKTCKWFLLWHNRFVFCISLFVCLLHCLQVVPSVAHQVTPSVLVAQGTAKEGNEAGDPTIRKNRANLHQPSAFPSNSLLPARRQSISFEKREKLRSHWRSSKKCGAGRTRTSGDVGALRHDKIVVCLILLYKCTSVWYVTCCMCYFIVCVGLFVCACVLLLFELCKLYDLLSVRLILQ